MKLRIGIIGCGGIATGKHLSALKSNGDLCEVVAFCDGILDRAKKAAQEYGVENAQVARIIMSCWRIRMWMLYMS